MSDGEIVDSAAVEMGLASGAAGVDSDVDNVAEPASDGPGARDGVKEPGVAVGGAEEGAVAPGQDPTSTDVDTALETEGDAELLAESLTDEDLEDEPQETVTTEAVRSHRLAQLESEGDIAADYLEELLDIADMDGDIDTFVEGERAHVSIVTDSEVLVGKHGEVLDALQELARLAVMTETGHRSRLMLDVAGHRARRQKELQLLAQDAISEVRSSGEPVRLEPMNPFERKIVHDTVAAAGLVSESEGQEPDRRVVVRPAD
jgi:spoIIIJ-associated protein